MSNEPDLFAGPDPLGGAMLPVTPYAGTSGWSGTDTSRDAAVYADTHGITADSQRGVLRYVLAAGYRGATVKEIRDRRPDLGHHGRISGALSVLHMRGHLALLSISRERCHVYVWPQHVEGRDTIEHASNRSKVEFCPRCGHDLDEPYDGPQAVEPPF